MDMALLFHIVGWKAPGHRAVAALCLVAGYAASASTMGVPRQAVRSIEVSQALWASPWAIGALVLAAAVIATVLIFAQRNRMNERERKELEYEQERLSRSAAMSRAAYLQSENERLAEHNRSHEFRKSVMEGSSDAIFSLDNEGCLTLFNAPLQEMVGDQPLAAGMLFYSLFEAKQARKIKKALSDVMARGRKIDDLSVNITPNDASPRYLSLALSPLRVEGELEGVVGVARDVTEKRNLEQFRSDMIRMFVHDLRNPLSNMLMAGRTLTENQDLSSDRSRQIAKMIETNSEQAIVLVEGMLDVSRLEAGAMPLDLEEIDVEKTVAQILEPMTPAADQKNLALVTNFAANVPDAYADANLLKRVLRNLVDNAIKFTPAGGRIALQVRLRDKQLEVAVSDTGPGIPPDLRPYLFQKFAAGAGPESGSGLGLAFCRLAVESMGGRLWLDTERVSGATFRFTLQIAEAAASSP